MADQPIGFAPDGHPVFDNTPTVVSVLAKIEDRLLVIRRNNEPGKGLLGLPGGYHMRGESWQKAGVREVYEETGFALNPNACKFISLVTDEYGNNLIIAENTGAYVHFGEPDAAEVQEIVLIAQPGSPDDWAFPRHYQAAIDYFRRN